LFRCSTTTHDITTCRVQWRATHQNKKNSRYKVQGTGAIFSGEFTKKQTNGNDSHTHTPTCIYACSHTHAHKHTFVDVSAFIYTHTRTVPHAYSLTPTHGHSPTYPPSSQTHTHTHLATLLSSVMLSGWEGLNTPRCPYLCGYKLTCEAFFLAA
jgi:hypothetical protein